MIATAKLTPKPEDFPALRAVIKKLNGDGKFRENYGDEADTRHDNNRRAGWGAKALLTYADATFGGAEGEDFETVIGDLMGDLMHLCDLLELDFAEMCEKGRGHYLPEIAGEF